MAGKSWRQRKKRTPQQLHSSNTQSVPPTPSSKKRKSIEMGISILGILLALVGLIALRPQITVSLEEPFDLKQPYAPIFKVANVGTLALSNVRTYCYVDKIEINGNSFDDFLVYSSRDTVSILDRGEPITVICNLLKTDIAPKRFDMALVVEYSPFMVPIYRESRAFRWVGVRGPQGDLRLFPQPIEPIREKAELATKRARNR